MYAAYMVPADHFPTDRWRWHRRTKDTSMHHKTLPFLFIHSSVVVVPEISAGNCPFSTEVPMPPSIYEHNNNFGGPACLSMQQLPESKLRLLAIVVVSAHHWEVRTLSISPYHIQFHTSMH
jgi:hypothetical protein